MLGFVPFTIYVTDTFVIVTIIVIVQSIAIIIYLMINQTLIKVSKEKELLIIKKDSEKEKELIIIKKDIEKEKELLLIHKDIEKERELINKDIKNKENYYMKQLSAMSQRYYYYFIYMQLSNT
jgi:hypothetical protein